jgi:hypothetical protein
MIRLLLVSWFSQPMTPARWLLVVVGLPLAVFIEAALIVGYKSINGDRR